MSENYIGSQRFKIFISKQKSMSNTDFYGL